MNIDPRVIILLVLWFTTGYQLGRFCAKYAKDKEASLIVFLVVLTISMAMTIYILQGAQ